MATVPTEEFAIAVLAKIMHRAAPEIFSDEMAILLRQVETSERGGAYAEMSISLRASYQMLVALVPKIRDKPPPDRPQ